MTAAVAAEQALGSRTESDHGRTSISPRAVRRVVSAVTAEALGVDASHVSVDLSDEGGSMTVLAKSPIHVPPLSESSRSGETLIQRLSAAQTIIRDRSLHLTGSKIGRVDLEITGVDLYKRRRVV